ncbi:hypothetical protein DFH09DRAFT_1197654, partial [Mycena vulgaris]
ISLPLFPRRASRLCCLYQPRSLMRRGRRDGATGRPQRVRGVGVSEGRERPLTWPARPPLEPALQIFASSPAWARLPPPPSAPDLAGVFVSRPRSARLHSSYLEAATATQLAASSVRARKRRAHPSSIPSSADLDRPSQPRPLTSARPPAPHDEAEGVHCCISPSALCCIYIIGHDFQLRGRGGIS